MPWMTPARSRRIFLTAAAALAVSLASGPAGAATTWTISPGGSVSFTGGKAALTDTVTGNALTCTSTRMSGTLKSGSGLTGTGIGSITGGSFTGCSGPAGLSFTVTLLDLPWRISLTSYSDGVAHGKISHVELKGSGSGCSFVVDGTRGGASDGVLGFRYADATGTLKTTASGSSLHFFQCQRLPRAAQ